MGATIPTYHAMANREPASAKFAADGTLFDSINKQNSENRHFVIPSPETAAAHERQACPLTTLRGSLLPQLRTGELSMAKTLRAT